jgi:hypothetical protein
MPWYVFSKKDKFVAICFYEPDSKDIASRGEYVIFSKETVPPQQVGISADKTKVVRDTTKNKEEKLNGFDLHT